LFPLFHSFNLGGINNYSFSSENVTKEGDFFKLELALAKLGIQLILSQLLQYYSQMMLMFFYSGRIDKNVINEYHHKLIQLLHEHLVHHIHEVGGALVSPKDTMVNSYCPYLVTKAVLGMSLVLIFI